MEETTTIKIRDIVTELHTGNQYRIIYLQDDCIVLCKMQCSRLITTIYTTSQLLTRLALRECSISAQSNSVCDYTAVRREKIQEFEHRKAIVRRIRETYGPDYMELSTHNPKPLLEQLAAQYRVSRCSILRWIRVYLQGGMDDNVLFDRRLTPKRGINRCYRRKPGRPCKAGLASGIVPSAQMREHFADALMQLKSGRAKTYQYAYNYLCSRYYSVSAAVGSDGNLRTQVLPISERPTFAQFYYYGRKQLGREEMDAIRTSRREQRNDKRVLLSDSLNGILGPWDCFEMDECEIDVSLVSVENPSVVVDRPIVYIMFDVYTHMVAGFGVSFDNNSVRAFTNCMLTLAEDKQDILGRFGLDAKSVLWPSMYLPRRIRCDRGAEYRSKEVQRICKELGITLELVPAATGSMKGCVEQMFHSLHAAQRPILENHGLIEKRYDSNHHQEASLNIHEFTRMLLICILEHNQKYWAEYPLTMEMRKGHVRPVASELWQYGIKKYGMPRPISNMDQFKFSLMTPVAAKLSRKGIVLDGLYYLDTTDSQLMQEMYCAGSKKVSFSARMDERDVGALYYLRDNQLRVAQLNHLKTGNAAFAGMTHKEYLIWRNQKMTFDRDGHEQNRMLAIARQDALNLCMTDAICSKKQHTKSRCKTIKHLRENRRSEQEHITNENCRNQQTPVSPKQKQVRDTDSISEFQQFDGDWASAMALLD